MGSGRRDRCKSPYIADALIKHHRLQPLVIAMIQSGIGAERDNEYLVGDRFYQFVIADLLPTLQTAYRIDSSQIGIGGVDVGATAAAKVALLNATLFSRLIMVSPPLGKGLHQDELRSVVAHFADSSLPRRVFQSVGRYETRVRFIKPAYVVKSVLESAGGVAYRFVETGSGHGLVSFRAILPEALAWAFPGSAAN